MKLTPLTLLVATLSLFAPMPLYGNDVLPVRIMSEKNGFCGSGFYLSTDTVVTNAHVVDSVCPHQDCSGLDRNLGTVKVAATFPALDLALLTVAPKSSIESPQFATAERDGAIKIIGFPGCKEKETRSGTVSAVRPLDLTLTANAEYGMSGAPVIDDKGKLVGILRRADSLGGAVIGAAFGGGFPARVIRADVLEKVLHSPPREQCGLQAALLTQQWLRVLDRATGIERGIELLGLRESAIGLIQCASVDPSLAKDLLLFLRHPFEYPQHEFGVTQDEVVWRLQLAALTSSLTAHGASKFGTPPETQSLEKALSATLTPERASEVREITNLMTARSFDGAEVDLFSYLGTILLWVIVLGSMWAFSGGLVFYDVKGPLVWKFVVTLAVLILFWPFSLVAYLILRRRPALPSPGASSH